MEFSDGCTLGESLAAYLIFAIAVTVGTIGVYSIFAETMSPPIAQWEALLAQSL